MPAAPDQKEIVTEHVFVIGCTGCSAEYRVSGKRFRDQLQTGTREELDRHLGDAVSDGAAGAYLELHERCHACDGQPPFRGTLYTMNRAKALKYVRYEIVF